MTEKVFETMGLALWNAYLHDTISDEEYVDASAWLTEAYRKARDSGEVD